MKSYQYLISKHLTGNLKCYHTKLVSDIYIYIAFYDRG